jgi:DNA-binding beta-propeller fold protein YncE
MMRRNFVFSSMAVCLAMTLLLSGGSLLWAQTPAMGPSGYHLSKTLALGGDEGWDYLLVDGEARRVYISHGSRVVVIDADTYAAVGEISDTQGAHGIALAPELGRGYTSNGRANTASIFDLKTLKTIGTVKTGKNPDAIVYDGVTKRVFTFNGGTADATAINAADGTVAGTITLGGRPEFAVADGKGNIYLNIEDTSELVQIDAQKLKVLHRWPQAPCKEASGLAIDVKNRRLFAGCGNKMLAVIDADSGKVIATPAIGEGVDANAFDPGTGYAFASNGEGTLTVVREESPDKYSVVENVATKKTARTMALDMKTHKIFLPAAEFDPPAPGERRGKMKPGTFVVLVFEK